MRLRGYSVLKMVLDDYVNDADLIELVRPLYLQPENFESLTFVIGFAVFIDLALAEPQQSR